MRSLLLLALLGCGGSGSSATPTVLYEGDVSALFMTADANTLYFINGAAYPSKISSLPKAGGAPTLLFDSFATPVAGKTYHFVAGVSVHGGFLYFCAFATSLGDGGVLRMPTGGGDPQLISALPTQFDGCTGTGANDTTVFVDAESGTSGFTIYAAPVDGSAAVTMLTNEGVGAYAYHPVLADTEGVYYLDEPSGLQAYFFKVNVGGAPAQIFGPVSPDLVFPYAAMAGDIIAYGDGATQVEVYSKSRAKVAASFSQQPAVWSVATDGSVVYWSRHAENANSGNRFPGQPATIWKGSVSGGTPTKVYEGGTGAGGLVVDEQAVYFVESATVNGKAGGRIQRLSR